MAATLRLYFLCLVTMGLALARLQAAPSADALATIVVYNAAEPSSVSLANYYAQKREIPADRLVGLFTPDIEEISRANYQSTIADPLRQKLIAAGWWTETNGRITDSKIHYVALIRGIPLKIRQDGLVDPNSPLGRNEASVDSELSCMGFAASNLVGPVRNPYADRFTPIVEALVDPGMLLVCRLDAPNESTVRMMIDNALLAEKYGLLGWAYIDSRGLKDGPYKEGDDWINNVATSLRKAGVPVLWDKAAETLPVGYPVSDAGVYFGWYDGNASGPFTDVTMRFRPGAIAVHLHSFSASTLRSLTAGWCGPLLEHGASVTLGNVYEPFLSFTAHLDVFQNRLLGGYTFAESAYMSLVALSWMNVSIGDPLYRPYAAWKSSSVSNNPWSTYRRLVLAAGGDVIAAAPGLMEAAKQTGDTMFLESLAAAQADNGALPDALATLNTAIPMETRPLVAFRLALEKMGILGALGRPDEAKAVLMAQLASSPGASQSALLESIRARYFPTPAATPTPAAQ